MHLDSRGYVELSDNLLPSTAVADIEAEFRAGAGRELATKMRAPWSSSALAVNSFFPWRVDPSRLRLAGLSAMLALGSLSFSPAGESAGASATITHVLGTVQARSGSGRAA